MGRHLTFLGAVEKLRKVTFSRVMSVCVRVSARTEQLGSHGTDFRDT